MSLVLPWTPGKEGGLTEAKALFSREAHATWLRSPADIGWQGRKPGILLLLHKVLLWSQEGPRWPGVQSTAFIARQSHDSKGGGHRRTQLCQRLLNEQELDLRLREPELKAPAPPFINYVLEESVLFSNMRKALGYSVVFKHSKG